MFITFGRFVLVFTDVLEISYYHIFIVIGLLGFGGLVGFISFILLKPVSVTDSIGIVGSKRFTFYANKFFHILLTATVFSVVLGIFYFLIKVITFSFFIKGEFSNIFFQNNFVTIYISPSNLNIPITLLNYRIEQEAVFCSSISDIGGTDIINDVIIKQHSVELNNKIEKLKTFLINFNSLDIQKVKSFNLDVVESIKHVSFAQCIFNFVYDYCVGIFQPVSEYITALNLNSKKAITISIAAIYLMYIAKTFPFLIFFNTFQAVHNVSNAIYLQYIVFIKTNISVVAPNDYPVAINNSLDVNFYDELLHFFIEDFVFVFI